ncbi:hypothetical protein [Rhodopila sp.]|uniref:hypothetical protein n=1 Tax=Rhodopila sp. TaxID=2480087 RepID=UPI003D10D3B7
MAEHLDTVADLRTWVDRLRANLPQSVDAAALGVKSKAPFQVLCTREALIWRTEELARTACNALERDDFAAAAILTRAVTENAALAWKLMDVLDARSKYPPQQLNDLLMRLLAGSGKWPEAPKPVHILDCLRKMDKKIPGVLSSYDSLSEVAHPNWWGVAGLYAKNDEPSFTTYFGRGLRGADSARGMITSAMLGSLDAFEYAYNRISDLMPAFLAELESI